MGLYRLELTYEEYSVKNKSLSMMRIDKYLIGSCITFGSFGSVYYGINTQTKQQVAVKLLDLKALQQGNRSRETKKVIRRLFKTESELMAQIYSSHVIKLYDVYENSCLKIMFIEYCNGRTLSDLIEIKKRIPEGEAIEILKHLIIGLSEMHKRCIVHRDLKSDNIMSHNRMFKIIDLGFAKLLPSDEKIYKGTWCGTLITMAPQVIKSKPYGTKADIWSLGVIMYEMIYGQLPFISNKPKGIIDEIYHRNIFPNGGEVNGYRPSPQIIELLKQLLQVDQEKRLSWKELLCHKIFENKKPLNSQYIVTIQAEDLKKISDIQDISESQKQREEQLIPLEQQENLGGLTVRPGTVTRKQFQKQLSFIDKSDKMMIEQIKIYYLEFLKAEYILEQIIKPLESGNYLNSQSRKSVELLYLLSSRCFFNMSNVKFHTSYENHEVIENLMKDTKVLYGLAKEKFEGYEQKLKKIEDKITQIVKDKFRKIFTRKQTVKKDLYLGGIEIKQDHRSELGDYTKEEQISYTFEEHIKPILKEFNIKDPLYSRLINYKKINALTINELQQKSFHELILEILCEKL